MTSSEERPRKKPKKKAGAKRRKTLDLAESLGATKESAQCFSIYLPDKDRDGKRIKNHVAWVHEAKLLLAKINGGATAMPPTDGVWLNEETDKTIEENTVVVYSFIQPDPF